MKRQITMMWAGILVAAGVSLASADGSFNNINANAVFSTSLTVTAVPPSSPDTWVVTMTNLKAPSISKTVTFPVASSLSLTQIYFPNLTPNAMMQLIETFPTNGVNRTQNFVTRPQPPCAIQVFQNGCSVVSLRVQNSLDPSNPNPIGTVYQVRVTGPGGYDQTQSVTSTTGQANEQFFLSFAGLSPGQTYNVVSFAENLGRPTWPDSMVATFQFTTNATCSNGPTIISLNPPSAYVGDTVAFTVVGQNFSANSQLFFNNALHAATYNNSTHNLTTTLSGASDLSAVNSAVPVHVFNPAADAHPGTSNIVYFQILPRDNSATADLGITKSGPATAATSSTLNYTLTVTNHGPTSASTVRVSDTLPASTSLPTFPTPMCAMTSGVITCNLGTMAANTSQTINIGARAPATAQQIVNTAEVGSTTPDSNAANNHANAITTIQGTGGGANADLRLTKTATPTTVNVNSNVTYTLTVTNAGPDAAAATVVSDNLPSQLTWVSATPSVGSCNSSDPVSCNLGTLASGASATVTIVAKAVTAGTNIINTGSVASSTADNDLTNNSGQVSITIVGGPLAAPILTSLTPNTTSAGSPAFLLTLNGSNFVSGAVVQWTGSSGAMNLTTNFVSATRLTASVPATLVLNQGTASLRVTNPDAQVSGPVTFTITAAPTPTPAPVLSSLTPNTTSAGSPSFLMTLNGSNFVSGAVVKWNGTSMAATFVNAARLTLNVPASLVLNQGTVNVQVANPDAQVSGTLPFTITAQTPPPVTPVLTSLTPDTTSAGSPGFLMTLNGSNFVSGAVVKWNGTSMAANFVSSTRLTLNVPASLVLNQGTANVQVANPNGQVSGTLPFTITAHTGGGLYLIEGPIATPNPVPGTATQLHVLAGSSNPGPITYLWDFVGPAAILQTPGSNDTIAQFTRPDTYRFTIRIRDSAGLELNDSIDVPVVRTVMLVKVTPPTATTLVGQTFPFTATAYDQFNQPMPATFAWGASQGTINTGSGSFMSSTPMQNVNITATAGGKTGNATMNVLLAGAGGPTDLNNAKAYPVPFKSNSGVPGITFTGLTANATIKIYSTDARLVQTLYSATGENVIWYVDNSGGQKVASWVYYYRITNDAGQSKEGKMVVIQ